jgi:hypothetical protein
MERRGREQLALDGPHVDLDGAVLAATARDALGRSSPALCAIAS